MIIDRGKFDTIGDRMKAYELAERKFLVQKSPVIIRLDGRAFHTFTKGFKKPFDDMLIDAMMHTTEKLCEEIQNVKLAYSQSDEITLFLSDYENQNTQQWFGGNIQKMVSLAASIATYHFNKFLEDNYWENNPDRRKPATFDARVFNLPKKEVVNCFIWRQQDAVRNSISALAQSNFSHKELHKKSTKQMLQMLKDKNVEWSDIEVHKQRGFCVTKEFFTIDPSELVLPAGVTVPENVTRTKWVVDKNIPVFSEDKTYVELLVLIEEIKN